MYLKKKEVLILKYLIETKDNTSVKELAKRIDVSERSVYYYLDNIELYLKSLGIVDCLSKKNRVFLNINESQKKKISNSLGVVDIKTYAYSEKDKINYVISRLLLCKKSITISELANKLGVSRTSLNNTMKKVYDWFESNGVEVIKKNNYGVSINYDENTFRKCVSSLIKYSNDASFYNYVINNGKEANIPEYLISFINKNDFSKINKVLQYIQDELNIKLFDFSYANIFVHISIAIERIRNKCYINMSEYQIEYLKSTVFFSEISKAIKMIEDEFGIVCPESEACYLTLHVMASTSINNETYESEKYIRKIAMDIICSVEKYLGVKIGVDKIEDLINGLVIHLRPAIIRMGNNMQIVNPLLETIKEKYSFLFVGTRKSCDEVCDMYMLKRFSDDEIAYITMHIGATLESNLYNEDRKIKVATLCLNGMATSRMLSTRLKNEFSEIEIVKELSMTEVNEIDKLNISYIISTVDVYINTTIPVIRVSPILNENDINKIKDIMNIDFYPNNNIWKGNLENINNMIDDVVEIFQKHNRIKDVEIIKKELNNFFISQFLNDPHRKKLSDYIDENFIDIVDRVSSWEEAIKKAGEILVKNKCINYKYIDEMINTAKELGPYIVISKGIAIPHARKGNGVYKTSMSLLIIRNGVDFGSEFNDPVKLVFCLALDESNNNEHVGCFNDIERIATDENTFNDFINLKDKNEVNELIKHICN